MKGRIHITGWIFVFSGIFLLEACRTTRSIKKAIEPKAMPTVINNQSAEDSLKIIQQTLDQMTTRRIDYRTFSAKIKVDVTTADGKQPDITAVVRMIKDSAIWVSLSATFLNIEVYRALITPNQVILLNKQQKEVQYRTLDYLQEVTQIPFDFTTIQNLLIGNPVYFNNNISTYKQYENLIMLSVIGEHFKNLLSITPDKFLLVRSKLDDVDLSRNRTADITYDDYENQNAVYFSTSRHIVISEKNQIDIKLNYKQYEFNKDLSVNFNVPKNYKVK